MPGPVAYQFQVAFFTSAVISTGSAHVLPSSSLCVINTASFSRQNGNQIAPVSASTTGQGLPIVTSPGSP